MPLQPSTATQPTAVMPTQPATSTIIPRASTSMATTTTIKRRNEEVGGRGEATFELKTKLLQSGFRAKLACSRSPFFGNRRHSACVGRKKQKKTFLFPLFIAFFVQLFF